MSGIGLSVGNNYDYKKTSEVVQHVHNLRFGPELKSRLFDISVLDSNSNTGSSLELSKLKNDFSTPGLALNNLAVEHIFEKVKELKSELGDKVAGKADKVLISSDGNKITLELFEIKKPKNNPVKCIANFFRKLTPTKFSSEPKIKHVPLKNRRYSEIDLRKVDTSKLESQTKKHNHNPRESKCNNFQPVNGSRNESLNNDGISNAETEYVSEAISSSNKPETNQIKDLVRFAFLDTFDKNYNESLDADLIDTIEETLVGLDEKHYSNNDLSEYAKNNINFTFEAYNKKDYTKSFIDTIKTFLDMIPDRSFDTGPSQYQLYEYGNPCTSIALSYADHFISNNGVALTAKNDVQAIMEKGINSHKQIQGRLIDINQGIDQNTTSDYASVKQVLQFNDNQFSGLESGQEHIGFKQGRGMEEGEAVVTVGTLIDKMKPGTGGVLTTESGDLGFSYFLGRDISGKYVLFDSHGQSSIGVEEDDGNSFLFQFDSPGKAQAFLEAGICNVDCSFDFTYLTKAK